MEGEVVLKVKTKKYLLVPVFLIGGAMLSAIFFFLINEGLKTEYPQLILIGTGLIVGACALLMFVFLFRLSVITIYKNRLEIKSGFGARKADIYRSDIISYMETSQRTKYGRVYELTLFTEREKYKVRSSFYRNYEEVKNELIRGKKQDYEKQSKSVARHSLNRIYACISVGVICIFISLYFFLHKQKYLTKNDLISVKQVVTSDIRINRTTKGAKWIDLVFQDYPGFEFRIGGDAFRATNSERFVNVIQTGEMLTADIPAKDYYGKLTREKPLGFFDKTINYYSIDVYGLRNDYYTFLSFDDYLREKKSNRFPPFMLILIIGIGFIVLGLYNLKKYRNMRTINTKA